MRGRFATLAVLNFIFLFLIPSAIAQEEAPEWRSVGIDPSTWTDGPVEEDTPMKESFEGNAIQISVTPASRDFTAPKDRIFRIRQADTSVSTRAV